MMDSDHPIHKLARKLFDPIIDLVAELRPIAVLLVIVLSGLISVLIFIILYPLILGVSCILKSIHVFITTGSISSAYSVPETVFGLTPTTVCSISPLGSILLYIFTAVLYLVVVWILLQLIQYIRTTPFKEII